MSEFPNATIDAGVLALPRDKCTPATVHHYVNALLDWSALLEEEWISVSISEISVESLLSNDRYPLPESIRELLRKCGTIEYDANTVARIATRLLEITPSFEKRFQVRNILLDKPSLNPDLSKETEGCLIPDLLRCIALMAIVRKCFPQLDEKEFPLIVRKAPRGKVRLRAQIHELEHSRGDLPELPDPPAYFEGEVTTCDNFSGLIANLDEASMLLKATDDPGVELAVRVALFKYDTEIRGEAVWAHEPVVRVGSIFRESSQRCCLDRGGAMPYKILRAVVEMLRKQKLHTAHALRTDLKGSSPQRTRGQDKAWRRDIDRKLHLHYWECPQDIFELASVTFHDDFSIPE